MMMFWTETLRHWDMQKNKEKRESHRKHNEQNLMICLSFLGSISEYSLFSHSSFEL